MFGILPDLRLAVRTLRRNPGFAAVVIFTLALGIGATSAIFSVVSAVLLRPLPYHQPDRIVTLLHGDWMPVAPANFFDWRQQNHVFSHMAGAQGGWDTTLTTGAGRPERLTVLQVTADMFPLLGVLPLHGRTFLPEEDQAGGPRVVVLSHALWQRRFAGDPALVGQTISLDDQPYIVLGIMPPSFEFAPFWLKHAELFAPLQPLWAAHNLSARRQDRDGLSVRVFARLKPGFTREQAQAEMSAISRRLEQQHPASNKHLPVTVEYLHEKAVGKVRRPLQILLAAVGFVLLIACANVANLLLARSVARRKELALRMTLGASRWRLIRQLLTESVLLALLGGGLGMLLAYAAVDVLVALSPPSLPRVESISVDARVLGFSLVVSLLAGLLFGLAPALQASQLDLSGSLKQSGRSATEGPRQNRVRSILIIAEVALAFVLLVGAGLMIKSFRQLQTVDAGFNADNVLTMTVSAPRDASRGQRAKFFEQLRSRVTTLPGVEATSAINHLPIAGGLTGAKFAIEGRPAPAPGDEPMTVVRTVLPDYLPTMGMSLLQGRDFTKRDLPQSPRVAVVNETFARASWPGQQALGRRIRFDDGVSFEIIGVVKDAKQKEWTGDPMRELYVSYLQDSSATELTLVLRTTGSPQALAEALQREVWAFDPRQPVTKTVSMGQVVADAVGEPRFNLLLLNLFAAVALVLAAVGIYGVMAYSVGRRTHEIGIRLALGAQVSGVLSLVVWQGMRLTVVGVVVGLLAALTSTRLMATLLFGVTATDPLIFALIPVLLIAVGLLACYLPARRATRIDPMVALRAE